MLSPNESLHTIYRRKLVYTELNHKLGVEEINGANLSHARRDIAFVVSIVGPFMHGSKQKHLYAYIDCRDT